ncbi:MAG: hypothetical protein ACREP9_07500 [Candidatus Dormibacteraceae bacterium]
MRPSLIVIVLLLGAPAALANQWCSGTLFSVYMDSTGSVIIKGSWRNDHTEICNDQGTFGGIDGVTCLAWFGLAVRAQAAQSTVTVYYPNYAGYTCANLPTYGSALVPNYVMITQ